MDELLRAFPGSEVLTTLVRTSQPAREASRRAALAAAAHPGRRRPPRVVPAADAPGLAPDAGPAATSTRSSRAATPAPRPCRLEPGTPHLCYCHTPMRYAWDFDAERSASRAVAPRARRDGGLPALGPRTRRGGTSTRFVANSRAVADRIRRFYGRDAAVVTPPVAHRLLHPRRRRAAELPLRRAACTLQAPGPGGRGVRRPPRLLTVVGTRPDAGRFGARRRRPT